MQDKYYTSEISENDALSLEDKLLYGHPSRQVDITHFIGDTALQSFICTDICHAEKQIMNISNL